MAFSPTFRVCAEGAVNDPRTSFSSLMKGDSKASVNMSATNMEMSRLPKKNRVSRNQLISIVKVLHKKGF